MKKMSIIIAAFLTFCGAGLLARPVAAVGVDSTDTFITTTADDSTALKIGHNLLLAGNRVMDEATVRGLLFAAGNSVNPKTKSEYAFIAGNIVELKDLEVEKDLFAAGYEVRIDSSAKLGRDVYAAADRVSVGADLQGDLSVTASYVLLNDIKVAGNVNIDAGQVVISGDKVEIVGKLTINADAEIVESTGTEFKYGEIEKYEVTHYEVTPSAMILSKSISIVGLFIAFAIIMLIFPRIDKRVAKETTGTQFLMNLLVGFCALVLIPIISLFLIMSLFAAPAGLLILLTYVLMVFLSQGFSGLWIGKLFMEKALHKEVNKYLEALIGIILLGFASLIPTIGGWIGFLSLILGLGLIVQTIHRKPAENNMKFGPRADTKEAKTIRKPSSKKTPAKKSKTVKEED